MGNYQVPLETIRGSPKRLDVCVVKTFPHFLGVQQVELAHRAKVIELPLAVIFPAHPLFEFALNPPAKKFQRAPEQFNRVAILA